MSLKYLFVATYRDGSTFSQNEADVSAKDPKRSAYFDVDHEQLVRFTLVGSEHTYAVDLEDGHFEIDDVPFRTHDVPPKDPHLVFFRRHRHNISGAGKELSHEVVYRLGWEDSGQQHVIEID